MNIESTLKKYQEMQQALNLIRMKASITTGYTKADLRKILREIRGLCV